jgi:hypothetical protein
MKTQELKIPKDIEIKFYRLSLPLFNDSNQPLSGIYHNIESIEDKNFPLKNIFSNFDVSRNISIDNLFTLNSSFGKVFLNEKLDGLITFSNTSENFITIKDLEITIIVESKPDSKPNKKILDIRLPPDGVQIKPKQAHTVKMSISLDYVSKYTIDINLRTRSSAYNTQFNMLKLQGLVKDFTKEYHIVNGNVETFNNKRLTFDVNYPFKINEKFHNYQMNICYIEIRIKNNTIYPLTIYTLSLIPKSKKNLKISDLLLSSSKEKITKIPLVQSLEEINKNENENLDKKIKNTFKSRLITIEPDEEINLLFKNSEPNLFGTETQYILEINWLNLFDPNPKKFTYEFNNNINTFNEYYKITVFEKPKGDIIKNQNFNVVLKLESKNPEKKYVISLNQEPLKDNDKSNDREIEIIDIIEKKIELNKEKQNGKFMLICKSDIIGNVYLPRLKFLLYEENNINPIEKVYDTLLFFNCVEN